MYKCSTRMVAANMLINQKMVAVQVQMLHKIGCDTCKAASQEQLLHRYSCSRSSVAAQVSCSRRLVAAQVLLLRRNDCCTGTTAPQERLLRKYSTAARQDGLL